MLFSWNGPTGEKTHENIYLGGSLVAIVDHDWPSNTVIATKYQHTDALGSPVAVTDPAGTVIDRTNYEPYGAAINKPAYDGIGYTGHVMDGPTGLIYMQQRYMDPGIGRFLSVDPVTANARTGANFNRYFYANNSPYKFTDPDGRLSINPTICWRHYCGNGDMKPGRGCAFMCLDKNGREGKATKRESQLNSTPVTTLETTTVRPEPSYAKQVAGNLCSMTAGNCANRPPGPDYIKVSGSSYMGSGSAAFTRNSTLFVGGSVGGTPKSLVSIKPGFSIALGYLTEGGTAQDVDDVVGGASTSYGFYWGYGASHAVSSSGNAVEIGTGTGGPTLQAVEYMTPIYSRDNSE